MPEDFGYLFQGTLDQLLKTHPELKFTITPEHWSTSKCDISGDRVGKLNGKTVAGEFEDSKGQHMCWYHPVSKTKK